MDRSNRKTKTLLSVLFIFFLCMSVTKLSFAQTDPSFTATPDNSNITQVVGSGFNASETVSLKLLDTTTGGEVYVFPENISTNVYGNFSGIVIIPTGINGTFNMTAATSSVSLSVEFTVPDLTGPQGAQGETGETGPKGEAGASAVSAIYGSYGLAIFALLISIVALVKKRTKIIQRSR